METFSKAKDYIFMVLLGIIGFFLSGVLDDVKEIRGDTEALRVDMREVQTRVSILERQQGKALAITPQRLKDTAAAWQRLPVPSLRPDYSGGYGRPDTPAHTHVMPISNPYGSSGGLVRLCSDTMLKGAPANASNDVTTGIDNLWVVLVLMFLAGAAMLLMVYLDRLPRDGLGLQSFPSYFFQKKRN